MAEVGRPTKLTEETRHKIEEAAALDASVEEICYYADISRQTYYRWMEENPDFSDRIEKLRQRPFLKARQTIVKALENPKDAQWFLERRKKKEFAERTELTGADGKDLPTPILSNVLPSDNGNKEDR
jgi:hypothetical protein